MRIHSSVDRTFGESGDRFVVPTYVTFEVCSGKAFETTVSSAPARSVFVDSGLVTYQRRVTNVRSTCARGPADVLAPCSQRAGRTRGTCLQNAGRGLARFSQRAGNVQSTRSQRAGNVLATWVATCRQRSSSAVEMTRQHGGTARADDDRWPGATGGRTAWGSRLPTKVVNALSRSGSDDLRLCSSGPICPSK